MHWPWHSWTEFTRSPVGQIGGLLLTMIVVGFAWTALVVLRAVWDRLPPVIWLGDRWLRIRTRLFGPPKPEVWTPLNDGSGLYYLPPPKWRRWFYNFGRIVQGLVVVFIVLTLIASCVFDA